MVPQRHFVLAFFVVAILVAIGCEFLGLPLFLKHAHAQSIPNVTVGGGNLSITMPSLSATWSGTVNITIQAEGSLPAGADIGYFLVTDGGETVSGSGNLDWPNAFFGASSPSSHMQYTFPVNTALLNNGTHRLYIWAGVGSSVNASDLSKNIIGTYGPVTFAVNNGHLPLQLRANYDELWLTPGQTVQLTPKVFYTDGVVTPLVATSTTFSSLSSSVATVVSDGIVTGGQVGDTKIIMTYDNLTDAVLVHVNAQNITPQFSKNGSMLTVYTPGESMFVTSMYFLSPTDITGNSQLLSDLHAANINTFEDGFYTAPTTNSTVAAWEAAENANLQSVSAAMGASGMSVLFTGDGVARGDDYLYASTRGPSAGWNPNPIVYALNAAKALGNVIGIEMVDEVSFIYGNNPTPQGQMGQPNGPQQIACTNNACIVTWPGWEVNAGEHFLVTGASSNANLNDTISSPYTPKNIDSSHFSFTATGVGTQTFTPATDPNLTLQVYADKPQGPDGTDYVHNDAFTVLENEIHQADGDRPNIDWPTAGISPLAVAPWQGNPFLSDFGIMYTGGPAGTSYPWGPTLQEYLTGMNDDFTGTSNAVLNEYQNSNKYANFQRTVPILDETGVAGDPYYLTATPVPVATVNNGVVTFSQPDNITDVTDAAPRFLLMGNSNSALNSAANPSGENGSNYPTIGQTRYFVYAVPSPTTADVYMEYPSVTGSSAFGTATFSDGATGSYSSITTGTNDGTSLGATLAFKACPTGPSSEAGNTVTISTIASSTFNGSVWYVIPEAKEESGSLGGACSIGLRQVPSGTGMGGTAEMIYNNNKPSSTGDNGQEGLVAADEVAFAAEKGFAGSREYFYQSDANQSPADNAMFPDCDLESCSFIQAGANPISNGPQSIERWDGMANANNLIKDIQSYLLQPKLNSPDYGPEIVTAARTSSYGRLLMMTNFAENSDAEVVDLSPYNEDGGSGTMYTMTGTSR